MISNVKIKSIEIGQETGVCLKFDDPSGALKEEAEKAPYIIKQEPYFCVPHHPSAKNEAECLGWRIYAICWVLDHWHHLHAEGQIIRVRHDRGHVDAIGHPLLERWLEAYESNVPDLPYPFYTGIYKKVEPPVKTLRKAKHK